MHWLLIIFILLVKISSAQDLVAIADKIIDENNIPEMAFAVVVKDSILIQKVIGHHKITEKNEISTAELDDYFHLGSNTKAITGFIAAYLVEKRKIRWTTRLFDLLPELKKNSNEKYGDISLGDLLSHRAYIQPFTSGWEYRKLPKFTGNKQEQRIQFAELVLTFPPVENRNIYNYSNAGYSIAAVMLEKASGKTWEELVYEILKLKLQLDFQFGWPNRNAENQPYGHWKEKDDLIPVSAGTEYDLSLAEPAGDISMNIRNYAKFIQLNIEGLSGDNNLLRSETYRYIHKEKKEYSIGWVNYERNNSEISEHAGSDGTFFSYVQIDRQNLIGYIVFVNSGTEGAQKGVFEMIEEMKKYVEEM